MKIFSLFLTILVFTNCNHAPINTKLTNEWAPLSLSKQKRVVRKQTKQRQEYDGLHLSFNTEITFLTPQIQRNNLNIKSQFKNWSAAEAASKKEDMDKHLSGHSDFFLTFYSPRTKRNKLDQSASDWKAVLKINGSEYEGKIKLRKNISHHNKVYFPELDPWSTPYLVTFPVATNNLTSSKFEVLIMGPEGMAKFNY
ncbi:MAG: hypothetical protein ACRBBP_09250 [Bdellovibrionales bacterium]